MSFYSKWALDGIFLMNHVEVMPCSSYNWLFQLSKYGNFCILMIFEPSFENHDQALIKWCLWLQKWDVDQKFELFDCQMTIFPLQLTVEHLGFLTMQFDAVSLETWHMNAWQCMWACGTWLSHWKPQIPCKNRNPNFDCVRRQLDCATLERFWTLILPNLEEYGRANFGVQQHGSKYKDKKSWYQ